MRIRYVIVQEFALITLLSSGQKFTVRTAYFRRVMNTRPRSLIGSTKATSEQLAALGYIPAMTATYPEEVSVNARDLHTAEPVAV
jgi:hypothetical protein